MVVCLSIYNGLPQKTPLQNHSGGRRGHNSYAFGDSINDLPMIQVAAHGVAMGNAVPELKEAAEFVTTNIHSDGVANGLAHYGLA